MSRKKILVTGGNRGIGREICKQLTGLGHDVVLTARSVQKGQGVAQEIGATFMELDVSSEKAIFSFSRQYKEQVGELDVLINNAGIFIDGGMHVLDADMDIVQQTIQTNVFGPWILARELAPLLEKSTGRIINISSGMGEVNSLSGDHPAYRLSKTALNALTLMIYSHVGSKLNVNAMCPGWVQTDMGGSGASRPVEKGAETAVWLATAENIPNGKFLRDKEVIDW